MQRSTPPFFLIPLISCSSGKEEIHVNGDGINVDHLDKDKVYIIDRELDIPGKELLGVRHSVTLFYNQGVEKWQTLSATNKNDTLVSTLNNPADLPKTNSMIVLATVAREGSQENYVKLLTNTDANYGDKEEYDIIPDNGLYVLGVEINKPSYNCNGHTAGLLEATGGTVNNWLEQDVKNLTGYGTSITIN